MTTYILIFTGAIGVDIWIRCEQVHACDTLEQRLSTQSRPETSLRGLNGESCGGGNEGDEKS